MLQVAGKKVAVITGITGQAGSYLADLLLSKSYEVHGVLRRVGHLGQAAHLASRVTWHTLCMEDYDQVRQLIERVQPDEYYNLAAVSFVPRSIEHPLETMSVTGMAVVYALEAIRQLHLPVRFFQAGSSEMFGKVCTAPQNEDTSFRPQNPYATAKVLAHNSVQNFRNHYGVFACNGILYNHESPRRGPEFVTRKITSSVARIACGLQSQLVLGNLDVQRDWGYAADFAEALWRMLQQPEPDDYVIGTGKLTTLRQLIEIAFDAVGLTGQDKVVVDPKFVRPPEQVCRVADISRARAKMNWNPTTPLEQWFREMIQHDLRLAQAELAGRQAA
ncbi:MAG: GDP-mannose 4,6-dehydratase [Pirellulaceae bacterium]|nr:GDP-mannose 4,6-dehydratase [Pirellulaceae bacterium]